MKPLISVIIPVYNSQDYLEKCIESVCNQTYDNLEIIIINDGSTDDTDRACERVVTKYTESRQEVVRTFRVISQNNQGVSASRNTGIKKASGELVTFVDADDRILPDMMQVLYDNMKASGCDISGCSFYQWSSEDEWNSIVSRDSGITPKYNVYSAEQFAKQIVNGNTRCWSKLYKKSSFQDEDISFEEELTIGEDMLVLVCLTQKGAQFCESDYQGYGYYNSNNGAMNKSFSPNAMDQIYCWERARKILGASGELDSIIIISVMLVVSRVSVLTKEERAKFKGEIKLAYETLIKYYSKDSISHLDKGYKLKAAIFKAMPDLYIDMYNAWKHL